MFLSVSGSLPTTSYVKMIEVWLIFSFLIPFLEVLILSLIHLKSHTRDKTAKAFENVKTLMLSTATTGCKTTENLDKIENAKMDQEDKKDYIFVFAIFMRDFGVPSLVLAFISIYCIAIF